MEQSRDLAGMLDLIIRPAFAVTDGVVHYTNPAAKSCMIDLGTPVSELMETGEEEYAGMTGGCLYLTLLIQGQRFEASATRMDGFDVFILEQEESQPELQAMALAARDLRGPLSRMMIAADRLLPAISGQSPETDRQVENLNRGLHHMLRLVGNMSDAARYAGQSSFRQELQDVTAVIGEIFDKAAALTEHTGCTLRFTNHPERVITLADTEMLERAIYNILSNAIKFSGSGSIIDAKLVRRGNKLLLTVSDRGSGIPKEIIGSLYSRHLRQPGLEDSRYGIGLGMVMIRSAALAHGGTVLIEQAEQGTRLTMTLAVRSHLLHNFSSPILKVDYAGDLDHALIELADVLPSEMYKYD